MSEQNHTPSPRRRGRGCLLWLGRGVALLVGLMIVGAVYESLAEAADARAFPPPGQMVDVGGYRLHIHCTGSGSPAVVIDAGWGGWSDSWAPVQEGVQKSTQVCTYDRAGMGYSEAGPYPRDAAQYAKELHTLLHKAGIPAPYLLAGHSMGGLTVRVFAHAYPSEVAGVVLIDSMSPAMSTETPQERAARSASQQSGGPAIPALLARIGLFRLLEAGKSDASTAHSVTPRSMQAVYDEGKGMGASFDEAAAVKTFGDLPLIVLSRGLDDQPGWQGWQADLLHLSSNSRQSFAEKSDHNIDRNQPQAAVDAILMMVGQVRGTSGG